MNKFELSNKFIDEYRNIEPPFGFNGLGKLVYMRTYSRVKNDGSNEQWFETIRRVIEGTYSIQKQWIQGHQLGWNEKQGQSSAEEMYDRMFNMKFLPPGRGLWAMGSNIINEKSLFAALNNCAFVSTKNMDIPTKPFCFLMDMSMLGVGVGFDVKGANKITIQKPSKTPKWIVVPDTREGWVNSLRLLLNAYFHGDDEPIFSYYAIRSEGMPIKGFGGTSSGAEPLRELHWKVKDILKENIGKPISETVIVDIMNLIGKCVVSGNVRRTAEIVFGDYNSDEYLNLKNYKKNPHRAEYGWTSNNSIFADIGMDYSKVADRIKDNGEPGLIWLENMKYHSRFCDPKNNIDKRISGANPCITKDTIIQTINGNEKLENLIGKQFTAIVNGKEYESTENGFWKTGNKIVYEMKLNNGLKIKATNNHQFIRKSKFGKKWNDGKWTQLKNLKYGDSIVIQNNNNINFNWSDIGCFDDGYFIGQLIGDGTFTNNGAEPVSTLWIDTKYKNNLYEYIPYAILQNYFTKLKTRCDFNGFNIAKKTNQTIEVRCKTKKLKEITDLFKVYPKEKSIPENGSKEFTIGLIKGMFDADGSVQGNQKKGVSIRLWQVKAERLRSIQRLLLNLGINSKLYINRSERKTAMLPDGHNELKEYNIQNGHELVISKENIIKFNDIIGFYDNNKSKKLENIINNFKRKPYKENFVSEILYIREIESEDVYDCTINNIHCFSANGIIAHNCVEQSLESYELCCLVETFPYNHDSIDDYLRTLKYAYLYAKTVTLGPTHWPETNRVMLRNRRIGCSISGIAQFITKYGIDMFKEWITKGYSVIQDWDEIYSDWLAIPKSNKTTSVKPSGTISLLAGATPGVHYPESRFYIRRVRMDKNSDLIKPLKEAGYIIEPAFGNEESTAICEIPVDAGKGIRTIKDLSIWEQFSLAAFMQKYWSDNQVSCTVTFDPKTEGNQIAPALNYFQYQLKGISLLPRHEIGAFPQMPYEAISEKTYNNKIKNLSLLNFSNVSKEIADIEKFCDGDTCTLN